MPAGVPPSVGVPWSGWPGAPGARAAWAGGSRRRREARRGLRAQCPGVRGRAEGRSRGGTGLPAGGLDPVGENLGDPRGRRGLGGRVSGGAVGGGRGQRGRRARSRPLRTGGAGAVAARPRAPLPCPAARSARSGRPPGHAAAGPGHRAGRPGGRPRTGPSAGIRPRRPRGGFVQPPVGVRHFLVRDTHAVVGDVEEHPAAGSAAGRTRTSSPGVFRGERGRVLHDLGDQVHRVVDGLADDPHDPGLHIEDDPLVLLDLGRWPRAGRPGVGQDLRCDGAQFGDEVAAVDLGLVEPAQQRVVVQQ